MSEGAAILLKVMIAALLFGTVLFWECIKKDKDEKTYNDEQDS